jgi:hypothetical protein
MRRLFSFDATLGGSRRTPLVAAAGAGLRPAGDERRRGNRSPALRAAGPANV